MARFLTAANSIIHLGVAGLIATPTRLQGFSTEDVFSTDDVSSVETMMGVDGKLSAGYVPQPKIQRYVLQADSRSNDFFERWARQQDLTKEVYIATGLAHLLGLERKYVMTRGFLTTHNPVATMKKSAQPRTYTITWQEITSADI